jgi:hypothetical protein
MKRSERRLQHVAPCASEEREQLPDESEIDDRAPDSPPDEEPDGQPDPGLAEEK